MNRFESPIIGHVHVRCSGARITLLPEKALSRTHVLGTHVASGRDKIDLRQVLESSGVGSSDELCESKIRQDLDEQGPALSLNY